MSYVDSNREEALWEWMASLEKQGMKVIAIRTTRTPARP